MATDRTPLARPVLGGWRVAVWLPAIAILALGVRRDLPAPGGVSEIGPVPSASPTRIGRVLYRSPDMAVPVALDVMGDRIILADDHADRELKVIGPDGALERAFGRKGRGPREFEAVLAIDVVDPGGRVMVYDPTLQRVTWVDLNADFEGDRWVADRSVQLRAPAMVLAAAWTPGGLVGVGAFSDGRLAHLTADGRLVRTSGALPVPPTSVTPEVWTRTYQSRLKARPDRTRFAVVSRFADRLEIYGGDGELLATGDRPYGFDPGDQADDPGAVRFGYVDLAVSHSRIYALFSGRIRDEGDAYLGDRIHVFDWSGKLVNRWALDARLMAIAVTPDGHRLYGIRHHPDPAVLVYPAGESSLAQAE